MLHIYQIIRNSKLSNKIRNKSIFKSKLNAKTNKQNARQTEYKTHSERLLAVRGSRWERELCPPRGGVGFLGEEVRPPQAASPAQLGSVQGAGEVWGSGRMSRRGRVPAGLGAHGLGCTTPLPHLSTSFPNAIVKPGNGGLAAGHTAHLMRLLHTQFIIFFSGKMIPLGPAWLSGLM